MNFLDFQQACCNTPLAPWSDQVMTDLPERIGTAAHGDVNRWQVALAALPDGVAHAYRINTSVVSVEGALPANQITALGEALMCLHPWRKGPFNLFGVHIDTEWRSDFKWDRIESAVGSLQGQRVLDVGCGSGYHCWRMAGAGAEMVVGIEPMLLYVYQYLALRKYLPQPPVWVLPYRLEDLPENLAAFDSVFSMGVLYHRRSPIDHLNALRGALRPGGRLFLETLVVEGDVNTVLVPPARYAGMGNVWFLPSCDLLVAWLEKLKFREVQVIDVSLTGTDEQRQTEWMTFQSLADHLDPEQPGKTLEGHPAPRRAILQACAPG